MNHSYKVVGFLTVHAYQSKGYVFHLTQLFENIPSSLSSITYVAVCQ